MNIATFWSLILTQFIQVTNLLAIVMLYDLIMYKYTFFIFYLCNHLTAFWNKFANSFVVLTLSKEPNCLEK